MTARKIFEFLILLLLASVPASATTYYVSQSNGLDNNAGTSPELPWKTVAKVQGTAFFPGDTILLHRGDVWREQLLFPSSGSSGNPITLGAYGIGAKPIIKGSDLATSWTIQTAPNVWKASITPATTPNQAFRNGQRMRAMASLAALVADNQWFFDTGTNTFYVYSTINPNSATMELGSRSWCVNISNKSFITVDSLDMRHGNIFDDGGFAFYVNSPVSNLTVSNVDVSYMAGWGIHVWNPVGGSINNISIINTTVDHSGAHPNGGVAGLGIGGGGGGLISNLSVTGGRYSASGVHGDSHVSLISDLGIALLDVNRATLSNVEIDHNGGGGINLCCGSSSVTLSGGSAHDNGGNPQADSNGIGITGGPPTSGSGPNISGITISGVDLYGNFRDAIEVSSDGAFQGSSNITIQYCRIRTSTSLSQDGTGSGIHLGGPVGGTNSIQYNLIYNNRDSGIWLVTGRSGSPTRVAIYGNTIWGNGAGLSNVIAGVSLALSPGVPVTVKNNLVANNGPLEMGDPSNNAISDYNDWFHSGGGTFMNRGGTNYTFAGWQTASNQDSHSLSTDPLVQSYTNADFRPTESSPLIDQGVSIGAPYNFGLDPRGVFPFATLDQSLFGTGYEIGAFVYTPYTRTFTNAELKRRPTAKRR